MRLLQDTGYFSVEEVAIALELIDTVLDRAEQKDYLIRVCRNGETVLGYYCVGPTPATESTYDLYWIVVDKAHQAKKIGSALLNYMELDLGRRRARQVYIETSDKPL